MKTNSKKYGLIGYPLSHTFSPGYFKKKFDKLNLHDYQYEAYPISDVKDVCELFEQLSGINVTIPYKKTVIPFLDKTSIEANTIGAVNTIKILPNGATIGYNTDVFGFEESLLPLLKKHHKKALVLGTGGASLAVCFVLKKLNIDYLLVSRNKKDDVVTYKELTNNHINEHTLIINTTPLGMSPFVDHYPEIPYQFINNQHFLYDLIYNPEETVFLTKGKEQGAVIKNGLEMLHLQAEKSWSIWQE